MLRVGAENPTVTFFGFRPPCLQIKKEKKSIKIIKILITNLKVVEVLINWCFLLSAFTRLKGCMLGKQGHPMRLMMP